MVSPSTTMSLFSICTLSSLAITSSFVINSNIPHVPQEVTLSTSKYCSSSKLFAVTLPAEQEDEKKKRRSKKNNENNVQEEEEEDNSDDWTFSRGGFIPNILKRKISEKKEKKTRSRIELVDNINDYKTKIVEEKEKIVVVRYVADWCRSCKAMKPVFNKMMSKIPQSQVKFVEVPLTKDTEYLLDALDVPSVPFAHVYHPDAGLVEEMKVSKPHFAKFSKILNSYIVGSCNLSDADQLDEAMGSFQ